VAGLAEPRGERGVEQLVTQLRAFWAGLGLWQRAVFIGIPALLLVGALAAVVLVVNAPPTQAPLFRNWRRKTRRGWSRN